MDWTINHVIVGLIIIGAFIAVVGLAIPPVTSLPIGVPLIGGILVLAGVLIFVGKILKIFLENFDQNTEGNSTKH